MKKLFGPLFALVLCSIPSWAQSVSISSPAPGATVGPNVRIIASANGGSYPIAAMRIYVDAGSLYTTASASVNKSLQLTAGKHFVVVQAWNTAGKVFNQSIWINVSNTGGGVSVSSPGNGATVSSPVQFTASATPAAGSSITGMIIYVDSSIAYAGAVNNVNVSLPVSYGVHSVFVQAWDNTGRVYIAPSTVIVKPSPQPYQSNVTATGDWLAQSSIAPDGAILFGSSKITPYYSNIAAIGMTKNPANYVHVKNWMQWYLNHLNWPDKWGLYGTTYDYTYDSGVETPLNDADSTDSYAATFLSLAWAYFATGDPTAQAYIRSIAYQLDVIGSVLIQTQQPDGLTWAKPDYQIKYLMDNCEAYRGLRDLALLSQYAFNDSSKQQYYNAAADSMLNGIQGMWLNGSWAVYKDGIGNLAAPNMSIWYPDATSQVFPVLEQVFPASDSRVAQSYDALNRAWPEWPSLSFASQDPFPWVLVGNAAALMGDSRRASDYINSIRSRYVNTGFQWTWYSAEAGWFMRLNNYMLGSRGF